MTTSTPRDIERCVAAAGHWARKELAGADLGDRNFVALGLFKGLTAFHTVGDAASAERLLRALQSFDSSGGDFHPSSPAPPLGTLLRHPSHPGSTAYARAFQGPLDLMRTYRNAWFVMGLRQLGAHALAEPAAERLERELSAELGAAPHMDTVDPAARVYDLGTSAIAVLALLAAGRRRAAERAGQFMSHMLLEQPADAPSLCFAQDGQGRFIEREKVQGKIARGLYFFDVGQPGQTYWLMGIALRAFAALHAATGKARWLEPAERIRTWLERSHPERVASITCAKVGWGSAGMFEQTGDERWRALSESVLDYLVQTQSSVGIWVRPEFRTPWLQPLAVSLDTTLERLYYVAAIQSALSPSHRDKRDRRPE